MRPLPEDLDAERSLLATLCAPGADRKAAELVDVLQPADFHHPNHRRVYQALRALVLKGTEVSTVALLDAMGREAKAIGGLVGLVGILEAEEVGRPEVLCDLLVKHRKRRELIRIGAQVAQQAQEGDASPEAIADGAAMALAVLQGGRTGSGLAGVGEACSGVLEALQGASVTGTPVGFDRLDGLTQGFQPGQLILLAARPGIGKTSLALNWSLNAASSCGWVAYFSLEMTRGELARRLACNLGSVSQRAVKERRLTQGQMEAFLRALSTLDRMPLLINDSASVTAAEIRAQVLREATRRGAPPALVVVDHVALVSSPEASRMKNETQRLAEISWAFKVLAKDVGTPVVALSQMSREIEKDKRKPRLSDLRDSGALEQDADIVAFIHRDPKPQTGGEPDRGATLIVAKHRDGELDEIPMEFQGGFCRYEEAAPRSTVDDGRGW